MLVRVRNDGRRVEGIRETGAACGDSEATGRKSRDKIARLTGRKEAREALRTVILGSFGDLRPLGCRCRWPNRWIEGRLSLGEQSCGRKPRCDCRSFSRTKGNISGRAEEHRATPGTCADLDRNKLGATAWGPARNVMP